MNSPLGQRFLVIYSGALTLVLAVVILCGFTPRKGVQSFDEITVHRINVVEPDGTLRTVISNQASLPGIIIRGKEFPHPDRRAAGMIFFNNEGTETGGLIYGSFLDKNGKLEEATVHLSFDQYMQDQVFTVEAGESNGERSSFLRINDVGDYSVLDAIHASERISQLPQTQQEAEWQKFRTEHPGDEPRVLLGRTKDHSSTLQLKDTEGRNRIVLQVTPDGTPKIQLLDATGKVTKEITAAP
jgi:hypothetical protein